MASMIETVDKLVPYQLFLKFGSTYKYTSVPYEHAIRYASERYKENWMPLVNIWRNESFSTYDPTFTLSRYREPVMIERINIDALPDPETGEFAEGDMVGLPATSMDILMTFTVDCIAKSRRHINTLNMMWLHWQKKPFLEIDYQAIGYPELKKKATCAIQDITDNSALSKFYEEGEFFRLTGKFNIIIPYIFLQPVKEIIWKIKVEKTILYYKLEP